jgi:transposase-like protein
MNARRISLSLFIMFMCFWGFNLAHAQEDDSLAAILTLSPLEPVPVGSRFAIHASLQNKEDRAVPNKVLIVYVDGQRIRAARTDDQGLADIYISEDFSVGVHQVQVEFPGTQAYYSTSATVELTVRPIHLVVETIPPLPNITFSFDNQEFVTDEKGIGQINVMQPGTYQLQALTSDDTQVDTTTRATFSRWGDAAFQANRTVDLFTDTHLQAGFTTSHQVGLYFKDLAGTEVSPSRVASVSLKRSDGDYAYYQNDEAQWLQATRVVRRKEGLEASPLMYSVENVMVDGANIVNRYQQRFYVKPTDTWEIQLLLYNARIVATDAILGFPVGKGVTLEYPNGNIKELDFGKSNEIYQGSLARGIYNVKVVGASGIAPAMPMALSRDQTVELKVLSTLDIGMGVALGITLAVGLVLYGRPYIMRLLLNLIIPRIRKPVVATVYQTLPAQVLPAAESTTIVNTVTPLVTEFDEEYSVAYLLKHFHPHGLSCPHCQHTEAHIVGTNRVNHLSIYQCENCKRSYNLYTGTPFAKSWLTPVQTVRLILGLSGKQDKTELAHELGLSKKTVVKWDHRLHDMVERSAMTPESSLNNQNLSPQKVGGDL